MDGLSDRDLRAVLVSAEVLAAVDDPSDFAAGVFESVRRLVPCDIVTYNDVDTRRGRSVVISDEAQTLVDRFNAVWERYMGQHPVLTHVLRTGDLTARSISEFVPGRVFRRLELYQEVYRPLGVEDHLVAPVHRRHARAVGIGLNRSRPFGIRERGLLNALLPHLRSADRRAQEHARLRERLAAAEAGTDEGAAAMLTVRADGRLTYASGRAIALLERYGRVSPLPDEIIDWWHQGAREPLLLAASGGRLIVRALENTLFVEDTGMDAPRLGLTRREQQIIVRLAKRRTNAEIAEELGISARTVAKHLEHVYDKLGVSGRRDAAARLTGSLRTPSLATRGGQEDLP